MKDFISIIQVFIFSVMLMSCDGSEPTPTLESSDTTHPRYESMPINPFKDPKSFIPTSPNPYNGNPYKLNVIYFVPSDLDTIPDYRRRISKIMLYAQDMFATSARYFWGDNTSFSMEMMPNSDNYVKIITLRGKNPKSHYPATALGGNTINNEVKQYFAENPSEKLSDHNFIITPNYRTDGSIGGPPFHGSYGLAFGLDYEGQDLSQLGTVGHATTWIGGLIHELGHGLNAPHNKELKRESAYLGTAMMRAGNGTLGKSPTYVTKAISGLLSASQVFSKEKRDDWYKEYDFQLNKLKGEYHDNKIIISGSYESTKPIKIINVLHDPAGSGDYDAIAFISTLDGKGNFTTECPLEDFHKLQGEYRLKLEFYAVNGSLKVYSADYSFEEGIPKIETVNTIDFIDSTDWKALEVSSGDGKNNLVDGKTYTDWHTRWKTGYDPFPHYFVIDMAKQTTVGGFAFYNRVDTNGAMKEIEIFKSDDSKSWTSIETSEMERKSGWLYRDLKTEHSMRYVKVVIKTGYTPKANQTYTHLGEFRAY